MIEQILKFNILNGIAEVQFQKEFSNDFYYISCVTAAPGGLLLKRVPLLLAELDVNLTYNMICELKEDQKDLSFETFYLTIAGAARTAMQERG
jgi:hypothetical protein